MNRVETCILGLQRQGRSYLVDRIWFLVNASYVAVLKKLCFCLRQDDRQFVAV